jgi:hypothetical protein
MGRCRGAQLGGAVFVHHVNRARLPVEADFVHCRANHVVGNYFD